MSANLDLALSTIDDYLNHEGQHSLEYAYPTEHGVVDGTCWRCQNDSDTELCDGCRAFLLEDSDLDPAAPRVDVKVLEFGPSRSSSTTYEVWDEVWLTPPVAPHSFRFTVQPEPWAEDRVLSDAVHTWFDVDSFITGLAPSAEPPASPVERARLRSATARAARERGLDPMRWERRRR